MLITKYSFEIKAKRLALLSLFGCLTFAQTVLAQVPQKNEAAQMAKRSIGIKAGTSYSLMPDLKSYSGMTAIGIFFSTASARVTAGLRWAPLALEATKTPTKTAMAQPKVITIQPLPLPFVLFKITLATTPLPRRINRNVPMSSPVKIFIRGLWFEVVCIQRADSLLTSFTCYSSAHACAARIALFQFC